MQDSLIVGILLSLVWNVSFCAASESNDLAFSSRKHHVALSDLKNLRDTPDTKRSPGGFTAISRTGHLSHFVSSSLKEDVVRHSHSFSGSKFLSPDSLSNFFPLFSTSLRPVSDTSVFPYSAIGHLETLCTGTLIANRFVMTSGHCVYNVDEDKFYGTLQFSPGQNGDSPYGEFDWDTVYAPDEWTIDHEKNYDYGIITLKDSPGDDLGWMGLSTDTTLGQDKVTITGYPGDKPENTMWQSTCPLIAINSHTLDYHCETIGGMSGSAVAISDPDSPGDWLTLGVHGYGGDDYNSAIRLTSRIYDQIQTFESQF